MLRPAWKCRNEVLGAGREYKMPGRVGTAAEGKTRSSAEKGVCEPGERIGNVYTSDGKERRERCTGNARLKLRLRM